MNLTDILAVGNTLFILMYIVLMTLIWIDIIKRK